MMSPKVRNGLAAVAMTVLVAGPIVGVLMLVLLLGDAPRMRGDEIGRAFGSALELIFASLLLGGILRVLVSIDERLEARN